MYAIQKLDIHVYEYIQSVFAAYENLRTRISMSMLILSLIISNQEYPFQDQTSKNIQINAIK